MKLSGLYDKKKVFASKPDQNSIARNMCHLENIHLTQIHIPLPSPVNLP